MDIEFNPSNDKKRRLTNLYEKLKYWLYIHKTDTYVIFFSMLGVPSPPRLLTVTRTGYEYARLEVFFSSCDEDSVLGYSLEISMDANFSSLVNVTSMVNNMTRKLDVDGLDDNTTYWMRMKAIGEGGESLYSAAQVVDTSALAGLLHVCTH